MAFSSGVFTLVAGNPVVTGTTISSTTHNNTMSDIADNGLTICLLKDGTQTVTANIPFAGFRLTNIGAATALTDAARASQVQNFAYSLLAALAGANTITGNATPTPSAYAEGQLFILNPVSDQTAQATLNVSSLGALPIFWNGATATAQILRSKIPLMVAYISTASATGFHVVGSSGFTPAGLYTARGAMIAGASTANPVTISAGSDDSILVSTASATAGYVSKTLLAITPFLATASASAAGILGVAVQANQEAGTAQNLAVTPNFQQFHPSAVKSWGRFNGTGTPAITVGYNFAGIVDNATGDWSVTFTTAFASATSYALVASGADGSTTDFFTTSPFTSAPTSTAWRIGMFTGGRVLTDVVNINFAAHGDQ